MGTRCVLGILMLLCHMTGSDIVQRASDPVAHLTSVTNHLTSQFNTLNTKMTQLQRELDSTKSQLAQKNAVISNLTKELHDRGHQLDSLNTYCHSMSTRITTLESPVAFVVRFKNDTVGEEQALHLAPYRVRLIFDTIQYQSGGQNYNTSTGLFTAPSSGTYAFFLTVQRNDQYTNVCVQAVVDKNDNYQVIMVDACPPGYTSASNMAIVHLNKGETASVHSLNSQNIFGYVHTIFSGMKLTPK